MNIIKRIINKIKKFRKKDDIEEIKLLFNKKNYKFFNKGDYNVNIIIIRNKNIYYNSDDDKLILIFKINNIETIRQYKVTCDPTSYYRKNYSYHYKNNGVAFIKEGQYLQSYKIGKHLNRYALVQIKNVKIYRDNNNDDKFDKIYIDEGIFGINIHDVWDVENFDIYSSAGCIAFKDRNQFEDFLKICKISSNKYGNLFSKTVLDDLNI